MYQLLGLNEKWTDGAAEEGEEILLSWPHLRSYNPRSVSVWIASVFLASRAKRDISFQIRPFPFLTWRANEGRTLEPAFSLFPSRLATWTEREPIICIRAANRNEWKLINVMTMSRTARREARCTCHASDCNHVCKAAPLYTYGVPVLADLRELSSRLGATAIVTAFKRDDAHRRSRSTIRERFFISAQWSALRAMIGYPESPLSIRRTKNNESSLEA